MTSGCCTCQGMRTRSRQTPRSGRPTRSLGRQHFSSMLQWETRRHRAGAKEQREINNDVLGKTAKMLALVGCCEASGHYRWRAAAAVGAVAASLRPKREVSAQAEGHRSAQVDRHGRMHGGVRRRSCVEARRSWRPEGVICRRLWDSSYHSADGK